MVRQDCGISRFCEVFASVALVCFMRVVFVMVFRMGCRQVVSFGRV